jgi:hypothetical protein
MSSSTLSERDLVESDNSAASLAQSIAGWSEDRNALVIQMHKDLPVVRKFVDALKMISALPAKWDSYSARPIAYKAIVNAIRLICETTFESTPTPQVIPVSSGSIQLEWHKGGIDLEIEIDEAGTVSTYFEDTNSREEPQEWAASYNLAAFRVRPYIKLLTERASRTSG